MPVKRYPSTNTCHFLFFDKRNIFQSDNYQTFRQMGLEIYILDLIGTFAFAVYGSYYAIKKSFDLFGITICAMATAIGGGTVRELMLNNIPFHFFDSNYFLTILIGTFFTIHAYHKFEKVEKVITICDSIGLVTFAFIGATHANNAGLGIFAITSFAALTAVGGGVIRDLILNKTPEVMHQDCYATIAIAIGLIFALFPNQAQQPIFGHLLILSGFIVRQIIISKKIQLWRPKQPSIKPCQQPAEVLNYTTD